MSARMIGFIGGLGLAVLVAALAASMLLAGVARVSAAFASVQATADAGR